MSTHTQAPHTYYLTSCPAVVREKFLVLLRIFISAAFKVAFYKALCLMVQVIIYVILLKCLSFCLHEVRLYL